MDAWLWNTQHQEEFQKHQSMSPSAQLVSEQLFAFIENEKKTDKPTQEVQEQVEDGKEVLDQDNTSLVLNTLVSLINNEFEHECLAEAVRLLIAHLIHQSKEDQVPGNKYTIAGLLRTKILAHQVWEIWLIVWRWDWDSDMLGALIADKMGPGKTFTSVAVATICKLLTEKVVITSLQSILWMNMPDVWVNMAENDYPGSIGEASECNLPHTANSVPSHHLEIQTTPPWGDPELTSALKPILVVWVPRGAETFNDGIDVVTFRSDLKLTNSLHAEQVSIPQADLNTNIEEPENQLNFPLGSRATLTSRIKPSSNGQLSYHLWSFGIFDEFHQYKIKNCMGWQIAMKARIGFKLQVTAKQGFHSFNNWCYHMMWQFAWVPEDPNDDTVMEKHGGDALYSAVKSLFDAIWSEDK